MKRLTTAVLAAILLLNCAACGGQASENTAQSGEAGAGLFAMDTYLDLTAYGENADAALEQAQNRIRELESLWSVTDEHSEIYAANHRGGEAVTVSEDTANLIRYALTVAEQTGGALEPTLYPVLTVGAKPDGSPWRVGVRDPDSEGNLGVLELNGQGVSVSGGYEKYFIGGDGERYWHILDPGTGAPARSGLVQTAVVSEESKRCDALSTALFVMGLEEAVQYWREHQDFEMILLAEDRTVHITEGLSDVFSLGTGQEGREVRVIRQET